MTPTEPDLQAEARAQLRRAIDRSGLSVRAFAKYQLIREPRTCQRWLSGESPIPRAVLTHLEQLDADSTEAKT